jgi:hypothetical protein
MLKALFHFLRTIHADECGELDLTALGAELKTFTGEVKNVITKLTDEAAATSARLLLMEQKADAVRRFSGNDHEMSPGEAVVNSEEYKFFVSRRSPATNKIPVKLFEAKTALINAIGQNQPLVPAFRRDGIIIPGQRRLTIRDLLSQVPVSSNAIEYVEETSFTNNAAPQYSGKNQFPLTLRPEIERGRRTAERLGHSGPSLRTRHQRNNLRHDSSCDRERYVP